MMMWPEERQLLWLVREGKGPTDVAEIMGLNCPKGRPWHATKELNRAIGVARFFARHLAAVRKLYTGMLPLTRRETLVLMMFVVDRQTSRDIGRHFGIRWRPWTTQVLGGARGKLERGGHPDVVAMLDEALSRKGLRIRRRRIMAGGDQWRSDAKEWLLENTGQVWYHWAGQQVDQGRADCSGLVMEVLKKFKVLPGNFGDMTAQELARHFRHARNPRVCDLVFYGKTWRKVRHVMFYLGPFVVGRSDGTLTSHENCVAGMCGGRRLMDENWARLAGAGLWVKTSPRYRRDFLGYRRVE